ncbi:hypothetical protein GCM10010987_20550 [Bradyrhizobium guangdongense]|uniref:Uncharacterized protein n=1 Tax=Bradyrhizobium guangdongense TaxID=1325090 RepID=A0AA88B7N2_9BRAD|nr:hypothetical protein GCM10010987_20550 [Bradyrhizobium guangdongense]
MKTVQVTSEAKASPIITAFTMMSADMNITQGDNSFMAGAMPAFGAVLPASTTGATAASVAGLLGVAATGTAAAGAAVAGAGAVIAPGWVATAGAG